MGGIVVYGLRVFSNIDVSTYLTSSESLFLDAISRIRLIRLGTRSAFATFFSLSGFSSLSSDSRGSRGSPGASIYRYSDGEGSLLIYGSINSNLDG